MPSFELRKIRVSGDREAYTGWCFRVLYRPPFVSPDFTIFAPLGWMKIGDLHPKSGEFHQKDGDSHTRRSVMQGGYFPEYRSTKAI
jgi:hypothetical protein